MLFGRYIPDLTTCDFLFVGSLKDTAYKTNLHTLEELRNNIHSEISMISGELQRVNNVSHGCTKCIRSEGQHFQYLL